MPVRRRRTTTVRRRRNPAVMAIKAVQNALTGATHALGDAQKTVEYVIDNIGSDQSTRAMHHEVAEAQRHVRAALRLLK